MKRLLKGTAWLLCGIALLGLAVLGWAHLAEQRAAATVYAVDDPPLQLSGSSQALAHGAHLYATRGCADCHGDDGGGLEVFDAGPVARIVGANITPSRLRERGYDADRIAAAIRHGVRADGTPLIFMPVSDWQNLGDADTAALVAYLLSLPDQSGDPGSSTLRPLGKVLALFGGFTAYPAAALDHTPRSRPTPELVVGVEYGAYLAETCTSCHGADFRGGRVLAPDTPPAADLTPAALGAWSEADFIRAMQQGQRPEGRMLHPLMPWRAFAGMRAEELQALWQFFRSLPPR